MSDIISTIGLGTVLSILGAIGIFQLWMLYDAWKYTTKDYGDSFITRYLWILIVFFGGIFGAIAYYFVKKRNRPKEEKTAYDTIIGKR